MARPIGSDDQDLFFLEELAAMAMSINARAQVIKEISDEPEILALAMEMEGRALVIQKMINDYRPRLMHLKKESRLATEEDKKRKPVAASTDSLKGDKETIR